MSHTSDLAVFPSPRSFVQAALDAVGRAGMAAVDMRYFGARDTPPADYCRQRVRECEIYVAVVGFRYGSLAPNTAMSFTELEFTEAGAAGVTRLVFLLDRPTRVPTELVDEDRRPIDGFRERLRQAGLITATFSSLEGLELEVFHALTTADGDRTRSIPRQLPAPVAHFAGRVTELALLTRRAARAESVVITAIDGTAGVGKTTLAVQWAHQVADRFPDGQLYVNLRGFAPGGRVTDSAEALRGFLTALQVPARKIPADVDARAALYRSLLSGRRMLVLLDNARDSAQVRPLLPGTPGCLAVVTSRNQLPGLVATDGAHPINLDLVSTEEARELLAGRLGEHRTAAEPEAVEQIIASCARLPLALAIVAARVATRPHPPLVVVAAELRDQRRRLDILSAGEPDADVRTVFSWSYRALSPAAARLFRLLGLHPGPDITVAAAASLAAVPPAAVPPLLDELTRRNLVVHHLVGRYTFHDLLRGYAADLAQRLDPAEERLRAKHRLLDHYLHTGHAAALLLDPHRDPIPITPPLPGVTPERLADSEAAMAWFAAELAVLLAAIDGAAADGLDRHAWQLAWAVADFLDRRGLWREWVNTARTAVTAVRRLSDPPGEARTHRNLARAYALASQFDDAFDHLRQALALYRRSRDRVGEAHTRIILAWVHGRQEQNAEALAHARHALETFQRVDDLHGQAMALNSVGWYQARLGEYQQGLRSCRRALELFQQMNHRDGAADTWDSLGHLHHLLGDHSTAIACFQQALTLFRELGDRYFEADTLAHLGETHLASGRPDAARVAWEHALAILDDLGHADADQVRIRLAALAMASPADSG